MNTKNPAVYLCEKCRYAPRTGESANGPSVYCGVCSELVCGSTMADAIAQWNKKQEVDPLSPDPRDEMVTFKDALI